MRETNKFFVSDEYVKLEAELYQSPKKQSPAVLVLHPHPDFGGTMHNNVVSAIFKKLINEDITCLRFNFSGVGNSRSIKSRKDDRISEVQSCIDFLLDKNDIDRILICGYSYGAAVGCSVVNYSKKILGFIAISFPFDLMGKKYRKLSQTHKPKYFIQGNRDSVAISQNFKTHYEEYDDPKEFVIINGADHFYRGYEDKIAHTVISFYQKLAT
ncbi:MAG: Alpha/beta hydrolase family protein [Promethearchaeota archaeon]|nr:MAG: Alpha/beta hydrolase family protein [Candidatus Lokiarchaeota archaeon]